MAHFSSFQHELPPVRDYSFLGTEHSVEKPIVHAHGEIALWFDPADHVPWIARAIEAESFEWALVDGYLPAVAYTYRDPASNRTCETTAFAADRHPPRAIHLYIRLIERDGAGETTRCVRLRDHAPIDPAAFDAALDTLRNRWTRFFDDGARFPAADLALLNACKASLVRALITFTGKHPRYGVRAYAAAHDAGFPPAIISLVDCLIDWGHVELARDYLLHYFDRFVTATGRFDYYGPSLAEYGRMLSLVSRLAHITDDSEWLDAVREKCHRIVEWLWTEHEKSPKNLIAGVPEADTRADVDVYFHNNAWVCRGLRDISAVLNRPDDEKRCDAWRGIILDAIAAVTDRSVAPAFIPPVARTTRPFQTMTESRLASYTNYRYWPELLSSGLLSKKQINAIVEYRRAHGGEIAGMTAFYDRADNWPIAEYARGLLHMGRPDDVRRVLYSHLAGHTTPQTWTAYEQVSTNTAGHRRAAADYCVPAQLVAPRLLAWTHQPAIEP